MVFKVPLFDLLIYEAVHKFWLFFVHVSDSKFIVQQFVDDAFIKCKSDHLLQSVDPQIYFIFFR